MNKNNLKFLKISSKSSSIFYFLNSKFWLVFLFFTFYFLFSTLAVQAAVLYLSPASGSFEIEQDFTLAVSVSSPDQAMNVVKGTINFPADKLEIISLSKSGSLPNLWVKEPSFSNIAGTVQFGKVYLNPGFIGSNGKILLITFRGKQTGSALIEITDALVLANNGLGTNILIKTSGGKYTIITKKILPTPTSSLVVEPLSAPQITKYSSLVYLPREALLVEGTAAPNVQIVIFLQKDKDSEIITFETASDEKGKWQTFYQEKLEKGQWKISAIAKDKQGTISFSTDALPIKIEDWNSHFLRIILNYILPVIFIILFIAAIFIVYRKIKRKRKIEKTQVENIENIE